MTRLATSLAVRSAGVDVDASMSASRAEQPELIDLLHLGRPHVLGAWLVGDVVVDPGPSSCLEGLLPSLERRPPRVLALTHIHLDHAGASGTLLRRFPEAEVWVHERGAPHLIDPTRLLESASRLYGEEMDRLWGEVLPVPRERIRVLAGGESLGPFRVGYTPGHASHHVAYMHEPSGVAFTGDVAGVRIGDGPVMAPTPPPDIDLEAWGASLDLIAGWGPRRLAVTHFGAYADVAEHLDRMRAELADAARAAAERDEPAFASWIRERVAGSTSPQTAVAYEHAMPPEQSFRGLARYLRGLASA